MNIRKYKIVNNWKNFSIKATSKLINSTEFKLVGK
jgi:hypothetical protein